MSVERRIVLRCDVISGRCDEQFDCQADKITDARFAAARHGWAYKWHKDFCPHHRDYAGSAS